MGDRLSRFGVGPKLVASLVASAALATALTYWFAGVCVVPALKQPAVVALGWILVVIGVPMWLVGAVAVMRAYNADHLVTIGIYALVRHPMYAAWIVLILPGIALLTASWPFFLMPLVGYGMFKALIHTEDEYLAGRFGQSYADYRSAVHEILPIPRVHHRAAAHRSGT